jgi:hypothetical protein
VTVGSHNPDFASKERYMSVLAKLAHAQGRRDDNPNKELARELAETGNTNAIRKIALNLFSDDNKIQSDCIKVLYEIGYINPELISDYALDFIRLLKHRNNRMVWGSMIALSTIAGVAAHVIFPHLAALQKALQNGSVITADNAIKTLARVASSDTAYHKTIFPLLLDHLKTCRPKEIPLHAEFTVIAVTAKEKSDFTGILEKRMEILTQNQQKRIRKLINKI